MHRKYHFFVWLFVGGSGAVSGQYVHEPPSPCSQRLLSIGILLLNFHEEWCSRTYCVCLYLCVAVDESEEEGEIRSPRYPRSSPPPEEEFCPCIRAYVSDSKTLSVGTVFVITREGAVIGRSDCRFLLSSLVNLL